MRRTRFAALLAIALLAGLVRSDTRKDEVKEKSLDAPNKVDAPKETSGETPVLRADPVPPVTPAPPASLAKSAAVSSGPPEPAWAGGIEANCHNVRHRDANLVGSDLQAVGDLLEADVGTLLGQGGMLA